MLLSNKIKDYLQKIADMPVYSQKNKYTANFNGIFLILFSKMCIFLAERRNFYENICTQFSTQKFPMVYSLLFKQRA